MQVYRFVCHMSGLRPRIVAIRADGSTSIGSGHVMRCLALAKALVQEGFVCHFLVRDLPEQMAATIEKQGHIVTFVSGQKTQRARPTESANSGELEEVTECVPLADEIEQCRTILAHLSPELVIVDHYAVDAEWETRCVPKHTPIMVIDDLANRPHVCEILLDQNLGRITSDYDGLVERSSVRLIGPKYALLRPEFAEWRGRSLERRGTAQLEHILITMGGTDPDDVTGRLLSVLHGMYAKPGFSHPFSTKFTVVMGGASPHIEKVREKALNLPFPCEVLVGVGDMARLMASADLAIGAAGSTAWERCCLGLPTLMIVLADNQLGTAEALAACGAATLLGRSEGEDWADELASRLLELKDPARLTQMSQNAANITEGLGTAEVASTIINILGKLRDAKRSDTRSIWEWRYGDNSAQYYLNTSVPSLESHKLWIDNALNDPLKVLQIFELGGQSVAHVRFDIDPQDQARAEVSICLSSGYRGRGIGRKALRASIASAPTGVTLLLAEVHKENVASIQTFERSGFKLRNSRGDFYQMELDLVPSNKSVDSNIR